MNFINFTNFIGDPSFVGINSTNHFASFRSQNASLINFIN